MQAQVDSVFTGSPTGNNGKQKKPRNTEWLKDVTWGANFQVWPGNPFFLYLSPSVGYSPIEKLNVGLGFIYNYTSSDYGSYGKYKQSVFGGQSYARYLITDGVFAQLQYDRLRQPDFLSGSEGQKKWVDYLLFGCGFSQPVGDNTSLSTSVMYNFTPSPISIYYPNRFIIQFGVVAGF